MDWEVELGVVIGSVTRYVSEADAPDHIAGYCVINDLSERAFPARARRPVGQGQGLRHLSARSARGWSRPMKSATRRISRCGSTSTARAARTARRAPMIFKPAFLVSYLSQFMSLHPGDVITTGTPPGVGMGIKPDPIFLNVGDVMELGIEKLGSQRQVVAAA